MKVKSKIFYAYAAFVIAFGILTLLPAPDKVSMARYHLSAGAIRLLDLTLIIPEAFIWYIAFFGYQRLRSYATLIRNGKDGAEIYKLSRGLLLLALGLPIAAIISGVLAIITSHNPGFKAPSVIINNYAGIVFPLLGFLWISYGARGLANLGKTRPTFWVLNAVMLTILLLGVGFCSLIVLDHTELRNTYHMSPELVMLTLGIPYIYTWFLGLFSIAELLEYSRKLKGVVYRRSWNWLISGFGVLIAIYILLEYLSTLSSWLTSLSLGWILLLLYVLLLVLVAAYIVIAFGAQKLMKIEEA